MKILLPTDFSKLSKVAVHYAAKLAKKSNAEVILLHAVYLDAPPRAQIALKEQRIFDAMFENANLDFELLMEELKQEIGSTTAFSYHNVKGSPVESVVNKFAQEHKIDLIVMGTKGASGLKKVLMGSNTNALISRLDIPVIAVPEHARFGDMKQIVYASDLQAVDKEMEIIIKFARPFKSSIHLLHIISPDSAQNIDASALKEQLIRQFNYAHISVHIVVNSNIEETIDNYIADVRADLLAMFTHKPSFFEKLFGGSVTREMAFHNWIPLLAIKKV